MEGNIITKESNYLINATVNVELEIELGGNFENKNCLNSPKTRVLEFSPHELIPQNTFYFIVTSTIFHNPNLKVNPSPNTTPVTYSAVTVYRL